MPSSRWLRRHPPSWGQRRPAGPSQTTSTLRVRPRYADRGATEFQPGPQIGGQVVISGPQPAAPGDEKQATQCFAHGLPGRILNPGRNVPAKAVWPAVERLPVWKISNRDLRAQRNGGFLAVSSRLARMAFGSPSGRPSAAEAVTRSQRMQPGMPWPVFEVGIGATLPAPA